MKKTLILLASAALLLVGCAKEKLGPDAGSGEMVTANFIAQMQGMPQTKAVTDGGGTKATRCVMEIYYKGVLYTRDVKLISEMKATFTPKLVSNRTYDVLFWADCGEGLADKYYTTNAEGGLQAVEMKTTAYAANDDARDAFYITKSVPVGQQVSSETFTLTRPFSQVNIITTDAAVIKNVNLYPDGVKMVYKAPTKFNLLTETLSEEKELTVSGAPYEELDTTSLALTLEMDYLFAGIEKSALDIAFEASKVGESTVTSHSFTNIPVQRNYRTNIKGALLTTTGDWTATIAPVWTTPAYDVPFYVATSIQDAQEYIGTSSEQVKSKAVDLSKAAISQDDVKSDGTIHFILKTTSPKDLVNFTLPAIPEAITGCEGWTIEYEPQYPTVNVGVNAPEGTKVVINAPTSHVTVTGTSYAEIVASTGTNTLVIPQGVTVDSLIIKKGAVEIHGTVNTLTVNPDEGEKVVFRECEGLSAEVFAAIKGEGHDYIDSPMYTYELVGEKYKIYKLPVVAMIGEKEYPSIDAALAAVQANETIEILSDIALDGPITISNSDITIDGNSHTIAVSDAEYWNQYKIGGANQGLGKKNMITVKASGFTLKNVTLDGKDCRGVSLCTTSGGKDVLYQNVTYTGRGSGHYYGEAAGLVTFDGCKFDTHGYAVHFGGESSFDDDVVIKNCELNGWSSFGACKSVTISDSHFGGANDEGKNGWLAVLRPYCPTTITNCTFSDIYLHEAVTGYDCIGLGTGAATTVILKGCKIVNDSKEATGAAIYSIVRDNGFDNEAAQQGSVFAFDATGNATDGYTAGTFYAINSANIKAAPSYVVSAVEGKDNIWTIDGPYEARIGQVYFTKLQDAVDAVQIGETITLLCDIKTGFYGIEQILQKDFTVDPQGHLYYASGYSIDWDHSGYYITDQNTKLLYFNGGTALYGTTAFKDETLVVPEGITDIAGNKRFAGSTTLKYVKLSSTVTKLWNRFFNKANALEKIYYKVGDEYVEGLAPYLTTIEDAVFMTCGLTSPIVIPSSMTEVPANLFQESHISSVVLPEGITAIGANAFRQIAELTEVTIPSTLQTIGNQAFRDCTNLKTINLLFETVPETIGSFTFNAVSTMFGATTPGVIYVKNQDVADALKNAFDGNALQYYSIKNFDNHSIVYYKGTKIE